MKQIGIVFLLLLVFGQCAATAKSHTITEDALVIYRPKEVKSVVAVFTDLDCSYCRKLHTEIPKLMNLGIEVRYLAYPRHGEGSASYTKMRSIGCAKDPKEAMTRAMEGEEIKTLNCANTIQQQFMLGRKLGIRGTPTIVFADGKLWGGYMPAERLAKEAIKHNLKE